MVKEIEKSILYVVHNMHFTPNQLAIINILYNGPDTGLTLPEITSRMPEGRDGRHVSGILSKLAQEIDSLENPGDKYGFTGYLLFCERFNGDLHKIRAEFRNVIKQHAILVQAMQMDVDQLFIEFENGLVLR